MITLVTYAADNMTESMDVCCRAALANGVDICWPQNPNTIDQGFKDFNQEILSAERGVGYWLWKPYHIYKAILKLKEGDILIYCDAGVKIITNVNEIISRMDQDIFLFSNGHQHVHWCKMDIIRLLNGNEYNEWYYHKQQVQASVIFLRVNQTTKDFIKEWLLYCQMPGFIDDSPSKLPNHPEFAQHRYDQAILTCLAIKYGYRLHYWADERWYWSQRHRWPGDDYPLMFDHHRYRNKGSGTGDVEWA